MYYCFPAMGYSFWTLRIQFCRGVSTIVEAVYKVLEAIFDVLHSIYISLPTLENWRQIEHHFSTRWNFPYCVGSLDGKNGPMDHQIPTLCATTTRTIFQ